MFKQSIARIFCVLTVFLLTSNVVLSAVPFQKSKGKITERKTQTFSPYVDLDQDSAYILEKDPFEDLDFVATIPFYQNYLFSENAYTEEVKHFYKVNGPHYKTTPIWLLVRHILI